MVVLVFEYLCFFVVLCHYVGCGWCWVGNLHADGPSRLSRNIDEFSGDVESEHITLELYFSCFHWALAQATPAPIRLGPVNTHERIFNIGVIILALVLLSQYIAGISRSVGAIRELDAVRTKRVNTMWRFLREHDAPIAFAGRCVHYIRCHETMCLSRHASEIAEVLHILPPRLHSELLHEAYTPTLVKHPVFLVFCIADPAALQTISSEIMLMVLLGNGQSFAEPLLGINFVARGCLSYGENGEIMCEARVGNWFCEEALWAKHPVLPGNFSAARTGAEVTTIQTSGFQRIVLTRRVMLNFVSLYAAKFVEKFNIACEDLESNTDVLFNEGFVISQIVDDTLESLNVKVDTEGRRSTYCYSARVSRFSLMRQTSRTKEF